MSLPQVWQAFFVDTRIFKTDIVIMAWYGFVYREYSEARGLFYDWNPNNLKYVFDTREAQSWYEKTKWEMVTVKMKRPPNRMIKIQFPLWKEWEIDAWFNDWVTNSKLSLRLSAVLIDFLKVYYFDWTFFVKREWNQEVTKADFWVLMNMKDIILWNFRISPIKIKSWFDKNANKYTFTDWNFSQDVNNVSYSILWKDYKTNLYWVYTPQLKRAMLWEKYNWSPLQKWQNDAWFKLWEVNFVVWSRELGKSFLMTAFTGNRLFKEKTYKHELDKNVARKFQIFYFGLSKGSNETVAQYIKSMVTNLIDDERVVRRYKSEQKLVFYDGLEERTIYFMSQYDEWVGRWQRPDLVIIDEAARMDYEVFKTNINTKWVQVICISTINYESKSNRFWEMYQQYLIQMQNYEPIESVVHDLWTKYWLDKFKSREDVLNAIWEWVFEDMRSELFLRRPYVSLKYTIEDDENKSREQKDAIINRALMVSEDYCLAELFWEISDSSIVFPYESSVEVSMPDTFEHWVVAFDEAENYDNAALVKIWIKNRTAYVVSSELLSKDLVNRYDQIKKTIHDFKQRCSWQVLFAADITRWDAYYREITDRADFIDYPLYYTKSSDANYRHPYWYVGKKHLIDLVKNEFFVKWNIRINWNLSNDKGLIDELANFKMSDKGKFEAKKWKDDQVNAMMIWIFAVYRAFLREWLLNQDRRSTLTREDIIQEHLDREHANKEQEEYEKNMAYIYANFW